MREIGNYNIGLDIGTNSLGWAVADLNGKLLEFKNQPMVGTVLIQDAGKTAAERRGYRSTRRRLVRRRQRITWLQELMASLFEKEDPNFFQRLKYSYVSKQDDSFEVDPAILFDNSYYKSNEFHEEFPTIYHLRKYLTTADEAVDIRLVYLAIHHIIKYRGNFLYEGQNISVKNLDLMPSLQEMLDIISGSDNEDIESVASKIKAEIVDASKKKKDKIDCIAKLIQPYASDEIEKPQDWAKTIAKLIMGYKANVSTLFGIEMKKSVSFSDDEIEEIAEQLNSDKLSLYDAIQKVYSGQLLTSILSGNVSTISDAYIIAYDAHHRDLEALKRVLKKYFTPQVYYNIINKTAKKTDDKATAKEADKAKSYANYIKQTNKCSNKDFCDEIKKLLDGTLPDDAKNDADVKYCLSRIEDEQFLLKPRNSNNGAIPNQLHCEELAAIIDNQSKFYPYLAEIKDKILSIASFRIPYFVGPLSTNDERHWVVRFDNTKIYPWNFSEKINKNETAKNFIRRLTNKCTYLINEDVLPKNSLLFSEYTVLNELSNVSVNGSHLTPECKCAAVEELFKKNKTVTLKSFTNWYIKKYLSEEEETPKIEGLSDSSKFISNLGPYIDMSKILGPLDSDAMYKKAEELIEIITIFTDREIKETKIREVVPQGLSEEKIKALLKLPYKGWGKFSEKLLTGLYATDENGLLVTIMDLLKTTDQNFMRILFNKEYKFDELISAENRKSASGENFSTKDIIMNYPGSPAIKKVTLVSVKVIEEITKIIGHLPTNLFIEMARGEEGKKRTKSRYERISNLYSDIAKSKSKLSESEDFKTVKEQLKAYKKTPKELDNKMIYLYFLQMGKCMYSGESLNLSELEKNCQVDHILPRCYIKDDSFDNLALVKTEKNQRKADSKVLDDSIVKSQRSRWKILLDNNLISRKKYDNLCRRIVDDDLLEVFINRQLVETRQISRNVLNAMKTAYDGMINVYGVSAQLTTNIKNKIGIIKIRELNDYHHAVDAYTALLVGVFSQRLLSRHEIKEMRAIIANGQTGTDDENRYGVIAELFCQKYPFWLIIKCAKNHNFFMNCLVEEQTGSFYNQTLQKKSSNRLVPKKASMKTELYGGYFGEDDAYYCVVKDLKAKKCSLIGIPIRIVALQKQNPSAITDFLKKEKGFKEPVIIKDKIKKYQHILYSENGVVNDYYISADTEVMNAKQLWITGKSKWTLARFLNGSKKITDDDISKLYDELCQRIVKYYPCYKAIGEACLRCKDQFMKLPTPSKIKHILRILAVVHANGTSIPSWDYTDTDGKVVKFDIKGSRMNNKTLKPENITFVDSSITGMFTRKYKLDL